MKAHCLTLVTGLVLVTAAALAQITSREPISNFRLPIFNDAGLRVWDLRASEVHYLSENEIELTRVHLDVHSGEGNNPLEAELHTPLANVKLAERVVSGPDAIQVIGDDYVLFGEDWSYDGRSKTVVIRRHVTVTLKGDIGSVLK